MRWHDLPVPLALHVGINTGPVVAGAVNTAGPGGYSVTGDTGKPAPGACRTGALVGPHHPGM